jgi:RNA polymerase sigma-70 factor, ECF subfamily
MTRREPGGWVELKGDPDGVVVRAVLAGDVDQYGVLVRRYQNRYARYAAQLLGSADDAEDAVQDAFVRAYDQLGQCRDPDNFAGWFFLILRNRCFAQRRRFRREVVWTACPTCRRPTS